MKKQQSSAVVEPIGKLQHYRDFSDKDLYVGIDVHKENYQVGVVYEGLVLSNVHMESGHDRLVHYLRQHYGHARFHCVYESSGWGFALARRLNAEGMDCIIVNAADIPGTHKERCSKTDKVDARKLAIQHSKGNLNPIYMPDEKQQKRRSLIRLRKKILSDLGRAKNRLKSELRFQAIEIPEQFDCAYWSENFLKWVEQQAFKDPDLGETLLLMVEEVRQLKNLIKRATLKLSKLMHTEVFENKSKLLRSIPGVGPLTSMLFLLEVGDVRRFATFDKLNNFIGLCPDSDSSGTTEKNTGLTCRKHNQLRSHLVEAAWQLIRTDLAMLEYYQSLTRHLKGQEAIIRVARKLLRRMRAVMLHETMYVKGIGRPIKSDQIDTPQRPVAKINCRLTQSTTMATAGIHSAS